MNLGLITYAKTEHYDIVYNKYEEMYYIKSKTSDVLQGGYELASSAIEVAEKIRSGRERVV